MRHLCDANVFIALAVEQHAHHRLAASWFLNLGAEDTAAFCRATQNSFLRLLTRTVADQFTPLSNRRAWGVYDELCQDDAVVFDEEPAGLETVWRKISRQTTASPNTWMDAYLAAFAIAGEFRLTTLDRGFKNFEAHGLNLLLLNA